MKIVLSTLNSKFIHSNLALRYLKEYVKDLVTVDIMEFTINQTIDSIISQIYKKSPDILGFSTYIWNVEKTLEICQIIKMVSPKTKILLGGPEVSFDGMDILRTYPFIDCIIYGEGEQSFREFIHSKGLEEIKGIIYRDDKGDIILNPPRELIDDLDKIPSPYAAIGDEVKNKIVYYESSRGCPFNCNFCLSSTIRGVRYYSLDRVKSDLLKLIEGGVSQVKFVDRTFNANKEHSMELMNYIMSLNPENINFHFEVTAHLIDDETLEFLKRPKEGLFQFEIGVQSTNKDTIKAIGRITDFEKLRKVATTIKSYNNIHQHLDLIAGLPHEDFFSFQRSFNDVYNIKPEKLQLGFLKMLKGSELRINQGKYGYKHLNKPPYEVLENSYIDYSDVIKLKNIEDLVEKYYNEGYFSHSIEFIITNFFENPFDFYEDFSLYWEICDLDKLSHSRNGLYQILFNYFMYKEFCFIDDFNELLKFDYIGNNKKVTMPNGIKRSENNLSQSNLHDLLKNSEFINKYLKEYEYIPTKKLINKVIVEAFNKDIFKIINNNYKPSDGDEDRFLLFDYRESMFNRCSINDITEIVRS